jgi:hypothetical protein
MTLRPCFSLLTLMLLTAAVAGGVKLWRGPHQYQWRGDWALCENFQLESAGEYLRGWGFKKINQGVQVYRLYQGGPEQDQPTWCIIQMYRAGERIAPYRVIRSAKVKSDIKLYHLCVSVNEFLARDCGGDLTPDEQLQLNDAIQRETTLMRAKGYTSVSCDIGHMTYFYP